MTTRDATAELISRDQILRDGKKNVFPCLKKNLNASSRLSEHPLVSQGRNVIICSPDEQSYCQPYYPLGPRADAQMGRNRLLRVCFFRCLAMSLIMNVLQFPASTFNMLLIYNHFKSLVVIVGVGKRGAC